MKYNSNKFYSFTVFFLIAALSNCFGNVHTSELLMPQKAENVEIVTTEHSGDTAQIEKDNIILRVSGSWAKEDFQRLKIEIENRSDTEFQFDVKKIKFESATGESFALFSAVDVTGVNLADDNPNNDENTDLYKDGKPSGDIKLIVLPKQSKIIRLGFASIQKGENPLREGSQVLVFVPLKENSTDLTRIIFNCAEGKSIF